MAVTFSKKIDPLGSFVDSLCFSTRACSEYEESEATNYNVLNWFYGLTPDDKDYFASGSSERFRLVRAKNAEQRLEFFLDHNDIAHPNGTRANDTISRCFDCIKQTIAATPFLPRPDELLWHLPSNAFARLTSMFESAGYPEPDIAAYHQVTDHLHEWAPNDVAKASWFTQSAGAKGRDGWAKKGHASPCPDYVIAYTLLCCLFGPGDYRHALGQDVAGETPEVVENAAPAPALPAIGWSLVKIAFVPQLAPGAYDFTRALEEAGSAKSFSPKIVDQVTVGLNLNDDDPLTYSIKGSRESSLVSAQHAMLDIYEDGSLSVLDTSGHGTYVVHAEPGRPPEWTPAPTGPEDALFLNTGDFLCLAPTSDAGQLAPNPFTGAVLRATQVVLA